MNKSLVTVAVALALNVHAANSDAGIINTSWSGLFTWLDGQGRALVNTSYPYYSDPTWGYGLRTQITGTFTIDTQTGSGSMTVNPFHFCSAGDLQIHDFTLQAVGDGSGGPGTLIVGAYQWDWNGNDNVDTGIVFDAAGFLSAAVGGLGPGDSVSGTGSLPASNDLAIMKYPIGPAALATTTYNTDYQNSGIPAISGDDGIGGSPMDSGPFQNLYFNLDIASMQVVIDTATVPVPATLWLFGSGLLGLLGIARRKAV